MKFEIAERIVTESRQFLFLRLSMIQQAKKKREHLEINNPDSPLLAKYTPTAVGAEYKSICFELINNLKMAHH